MAMTLTEHRVGHLTRLFLQIFFAFFIVDESTSNSHQPKGAFVPSKWSQIDPELVEQQAMTSSRWDTLEQRRPDDDVRGGAPIDDDLDGVYVNLYLVTVNLDRSPS